MKDLIQKANEDFKSLTPQERQTLMNLGESKDMVLGEDYIITLSGQFIFTATYHLKRGHCCLQKCRNCPYPKNSV